MLSMNFVSFKHRAGDEASDPVGVLSFACSIFQIMFLFK